MTPYKVSSEIYGGFFYSGITLGAKFNNTSRNNWKPLFEVNFRWHSTKTIRLFALDFYEVIVDEAEELII